MCFHSICKSVCRRSTIMPRVSSDGGRFRRDAPGAVHKREAGPWKRAGPLGSAHEGAALWKNKKTISHRNKSRRRQRNRLVPEASAGKIDAAAPARLRPETGRRNFLRAAPHAHYFSTRDRSDPAAATQRRGESRRWSVSARSRRGRRCPCFPVSRRWRIPRRA